MYFIHFFCRLAAQKHTDTLSASLRVVSQRWRSPAFTTHRLKTYKRLTENVQTEKEDWIALIRLIMSEGVSAPTAVTWRLTYWGCAPGCWWGWVGSLRARSPPGSQTGTRSPATIPSAPWSLSRWARGCTSTLCPSLACEDEQCDILQNITMEYLCEGWGFWFCFF